MRILELFIATALALSASSLHAQSLPDPATMPFGPAKFSMPDPDALRIELENGLAAYIVPDSTVPLISMTAVIGAGSADGTPPGAGRALAHILQTHGMLGISPDGFRKALDNMLAQFSVEVMPERTEISITVPKEDGWGAMWLLAALLKTPDIGDASVTAATGQGTLTPTTWPGNQYTSIDRFAANLFGDHAYGPSGPPGEISIAMVREFHNAWYTPDNIAIALSGAFGRDEAENAIRENFADMAAGKAPARPAAAPAEGSEARTIYTYEADKLQAWVVFGNRLPVIPPVDEAAVHVMNYILAGGHFFTRMWIETRDKRGLTNTVAGYPVWHSAGPGSYSFRTYSRPDVLPQLLQILFGEIDKIQQEPVSGEELAVAKGALTEGQFQMQFVDGITTAQTFAREFVSNGNHVRSASQVERLLAVTAADVQRVAKAYLLPEKMNMVVVGPLGKVFAAPDADWLTGWGTIVEGK